MTTPAYPVLSLGGARRADAAVAEAVATLDRGGVVALPTETVYGLCCRAAFEEARERIFALKGRPRHKGLPYLIGDPRAVDTFVNELPPKALRAIQAFWPGPLTLVLGPGDGVAVRCPDQPFTQEVLRRAGGPVQATSANRSDHAPARTAAEVLAEFPSGIDLLVDGGPPPRGTASTIARIDPRGAWSILRTGGAETASLVETLATRVVLVCTGNTCRSPMAAAVLRRELGAALGVSADRLPASGFLVVSAGLQASPGLPMSPEAVRLLVERGIPSDDLRHESRVLHDALVLESDHVWVMTADHRQALARRFPELRGRIELLDPAGDDIVDPIGLGPAAYRESLGQIRRSIETRLPALLASAPLKNAAGDA